VFLASVVIGSQVFQCITEIFRCVTVGWDGHIDRRCLRADTTVTRACTAAACTACDGGRDVAVVVAADEAEVVVAVAMEPLLVTVLVLDPLLIAVLVTGTDVLTTSATVVDVPIEEEDHADEDGTTEDEETEAETLVMVLAEVVEAEITALVVFGATDTDESVIEVAPVRVATLDDTAEEEDGLMAEEPPEDGCA